MIEPVRRAFVVLEALNRRRSTTLSVLAAETGLPRPTLVRLLKTLIELGYASRVSRQDGYRLTDHVLALAGGVRFIDHLVDAAIPHMSRFTAEHGWPLYLATLSSGAMAIRHSTAPESPMSFETAGYNRRSPMLIGTPMPWMRVGRGGCVKAKPSRRIRSNRAASAGLRRAPMPRRMVRRSSSEQ